MSRFLSVMGRAGFTFSVLLLLLACVPACGSSKPSTLAQRVTPQQQKADIPAVIAGLEAELARALSELGVVDPAKVPMAAPSGTDNAVFDLQASLIDPDGSGGNPPTGVQLTWTERMIGDYDANGEVGSPDLIPISQHWQTRVHYDAPALHGGLEWWPAGDPDDDGTGTANWVKARVDGDANTEVGNSDVVKIAQHWHERSSGYLIERAVNYGTGELDWEEQPLDLGDGAFPSSPRTLLGDDLLSTPARYSVTVPLAGTELSVYFRVRAYDTGTQTSGEASNTAHVTLDAATDNVPPYWTDTVGVTSLTPAHGQLTVGFGEAVDEDSPPVRYRVYWAEGNSAQPDAPFNYETANMAETDAAPHIIMGLTDGTYYRAAVRAVDSATVPNEELNTTVLGREAGAADIYPPVWQGEAGIAHAYQGTDTVIVAWEKAIDSTEDEYGTWESGPVIYRVYYGEGTQPDWSTASYIEYEDTGLERYIVEILTIDTSVDHWFAVRSLDQAEYPNEDSNNAIINCPGLSVIDMPFPNPPAEIPANSTFYGILFPTSIDSQLYCVCLFYKSSNNDVWFVAYDPVENHLEHRLTFQLTENCEIYNKQCYLDSNDALNILYRKVNNLTNIRAIERFTEPDHQLLSLPYPSADTSIPMLGSLPDGSFWIIDSRSTIYSIIPPVIDTSFNVNFWPFDNPTEFWFEDSDGYQNISFSGAAVLSDNSLVLPLNVASSDSPIPAWRLTFSSSGHNVEQEVPLDAYGACYKGSFGFNQNYPIDMYKLFISSDELLVNYYYNNELLQCSSIGDYLKLDSAYECYVSSWDSIVIKLMLTSDNIHSPYGTKDKLGLVRTKINGNPLDIPQKSEYSDSDIHPSYELAAIAQDSILVPYYIDTTFSGFIIVERSSG